ncbi:MAG: hypothetical protein ACM34I_04610 [bacterium]
MLIDPNRAMKVMTLSGKKKPDEKIVQVRNGNIVELILVRKTWWDRVKEKKM